MSDWTYRLYAKQLEMGLIGPVACGPASLLTCLKLLGNRQVTPKRVLKAIDVSVWQQLCEWDFGADEHQLARGTKRLGYQADIHNFSPVEKGKAWQHLVACSERHIPAILGVDEFSHWIVAYGTDAQGTWIFDPWTDDFPHKHDSGFKRWKRDRLLKRWYHYGLDDEDEPFDGFQLLRIAPSKAKTREAHRRYGCPPGNFLLGWIDDKDDAVVVAKLREDVDAIFSNIPQRGGERAIDLFASRLQSASYKAVCDWCGEIDKRGVRERLDLIDDLLRHLPYRVPQSHQDQFAVELATVITADAFQDVDCDPGDGDPNEVLTYEEDAAAVFSKCSSGMPAHEFLSRHQSLLADQISGWLEYSTPSSVRKHLRCLIGEAAGKGLRVRRGRELETLVEVTVLLTIYDWLV